MRNYSRMALWAIPYVVVTMGFTLDFIKLKEFEKTLNIPPIELLKLDNKFRDRVWLMEETLVARGIMLPSRSRFNRLLHKVLNGKEITMVAIGGSNTAGGVLGRDENSMEGLYMNVFAKWWKRAITPLSGSQINVYNLGISGVGSYFCAFCFETFLPEGKAIDIVLIEQAVNYRRSRKQPSRPLEVLIRRVLSLNPTPLAALVNFVPSLGKLRNFHCKNLEDFGANSVAMHYGITSFSLKPILCRPNKRGDYEVRKDLVAIPGVVASDGAHVGVIAHAQTGLMMINTVRSVFLSRLEHPPRKPDTFPSTAIPPPLYPIKPTEILHNPQCWLGPTPNGCVDMQRPSLLMTVQNSNAFKFHKLLNKLPLLCNGRERTDKHAGWGGWGDKAYISFSITVKPWKCTACQDRSRSVIIIIRNWGNGGRALVWLDDDVESARDITNAHEFGTLLYTVSGRVRPGNHTLHVQTVRKGFFVVSGVTIGPPDFSKYGVM
ncbi:uncharacterized protein LOC125567394 [Nematostella vectensis]|uniref:uncharacterized protein LOC125567394 n=1 Tax=Nematostella vectensis TaxID=45351 RepID=UPI00207703BD|nr:uncharacterized protein LOC125567394 [Nematostella vectensis]